MNVIRTILKPYRGICKTSTYIWNDTPLYSSPNRIPALAGRTNQPANLNPSCSSSSHTSPLTMPLTTRSTLAACSSAASNAARGSFLAARPTSVCRAPPHTRASRSTSASGLPAAMPFCTRQMARISSARIHNTRGGASPSPRRPSSMRASRERSPESIVARHVHHRLAHCVEVDLPGRQEQRELLDLLMRRKEIAFDAVGEKLQGFRARALLLPREASSDPLRKPRAFDRIDVDDGSKALERLEPGGRLAGLVQARQRNDAERVGREPSAKRFDRFGAIVAGFAGDKAQLDQFPVAEEREVRDARAELAPVKAALRREDDPF